GLVFLTPLDHECFVFSTGASPVWLPQTCLRPTCIEPTQELKLGGFCLAREAKSAPTMRKKTALLFRYCQAMTRRNAITPENRFRIPTLCSRPEVICIRVFTRGAESPAS